MSRRENLALNVAKLEHASEPHPQPPHIFIEPPKIIRKILTGSQHSEQTRSRTKQTKTADLNPPPGYTHQGHGIRPRRTPDGVHLLQLQPRPLFCGDLRGMHACKRGWEGEGMSSPVYVFT